MPALRTGQMVVLKSIPDSLLDGLPDEDVAAIRAIIGRPIMFVGYDSETRAEFEFRGTFGMVHSIWIDSDKLDIA